MKNKLAALILTSLRKNPGMKVGDLRQYIASMGYFVSISVVYSHLQLLQMDGKVRNSRPRWFIK